MLYRSAVRHDLPTLVKMLADDPIGAARENPSDPLPESYSAAFVAIENDPNNEILVADEAGSIAGFLQLTFIPCITHQGGLRAMIEGVRVRSHLRGQGIGAALVKHAVGIARDRKCRLVQLTTDKSRPDALAFYERLGFRASHEGLKLDLDTER